MAARVKRPTGRPVHRYHGRGCGASHPLIMRKIKAQDKVRDTKARGGSFTLVLETLTVGARDDVRPLGEDGGGR